MTKGYPPRQVRLVVLVAAAVFVCVCLRVRVRYIRPPSLSADPAQIWKRVIKGLKGGDVKSLSGQSAHTFQWTHRHSLLVYCAH